MASDAEATSRFYQWAVTFGWPLADFECVHGAMPHDQVQVCTCFVASLPVAASKGLKAADDYGG